MLKRGGELRDERRETRTKERHIEVGRRRQMIRKEAEKSSKTFFKGELFQKESER
jgi:hypothetical protein